MPVFILSLRGSVLTTAAIPSMFIAVNNCGIASVSSSFPRNDIRFLLYNQLTGMLYSNWNSKALIQTQPRTD